MELFFGRKEGGKERKEERKEARDERGRSREGGKEREEKRLGDLNLTLPSNSGRVQGVCGGPLCSSLSQGGDPKALLAFIPPISGVKI